ncbi:Metalloenzyme, LuxS/M16 peptidase-like protein [Cladochytrium replicatum]|nr:Metalloenzyme, LuxS/M16 peptidase-like protein [Cladochytrium replicatum]
MWIIKQARVRPLSPLRSRPLLQARSFTSALSTSAPTSNFLGLSKLWDSGAAPSSLKDHTPSPTVVTSLPNGIRVATLNSPGHFAALGVYIDAGTRYETPELLGVSHVLDRMSFKSTRDMTSEEMVRKLETLGGNVIAHSSREGIMYQASVFPKDTEAIVYIFSQIVRYPRILKEELDEVKEGTLFEISELAEKPEMMVPEALHQVAFSNPSTGEPNTLGLSVLCPPDMLEAMTPETLRRYRSNWFTPNRTVVAGIGMEHAQLVDLVGKYFGDIPAVSKETLALQTSAAKPSYGGNVQLFDTTDMPPPSNPDQRVFTHVYIAFEAPSIRDPDVYALATLTSLMGGGGSFSAGGPGKGMHTRLYTQVLNRYHWIESCNMINYAYTDTGLFGISASVDPDHPDAHRFVIPVLCEQLLLMTNRITEKELSRAKNQLKSNLLMTLESKIVEVEDIGRQVLLYGQRVDAREMCRRIEALTTEDLKRVARRTVWRGDGGLEAKWERGADGGDSGPDTERSAVFGGDGLVEAVADWEEEPRGDAEAAVWVGTMMNREWRSENN